MSDMESVTRGLECCANNKCAGKDCTYWPYRDCITKLVRDALVLMKEQGKEIKALKLLVEWAEECDFGFDQFPDEYERYKDEIKDMKYIDGMIHVAKRTLEDNGAFD